MACYRISPKASLQLNVNNLFDKTYQTAVNRYSEAVWGAPRNVQLELNCQF